MHFQFPPLIDVCETCRKVKSSIEYSSFDFCIIHAYVQHEINCGTQEVNESFMLNE